MKKRYFFLTTQKGQCRKDCKQLLGWNPEAEKACRKACGSDNPPESATAWWNGLSPEIRIQYEGGPAQQYLYDEVIQEAPNYTPLYIGAGLVIAALLYFLIR